MTSFNLIKAAKNAWAFTVYKFLALEIVKPKPFFSSLKDMCRPAWLSAAPLVKGQDLDPTLSKFMSIRACSNEEEKRELWNQFGSFNECRAFLGISTLLARTIQDISYTERLISGLPYSPSIDNPCSWEGVRFTYANPSLYNLAANENENSNKIRVVVEIEDEIEVYMDQWAYGTLALMSNIFGLVGFYLGYSLIDVVTLLENTYLRITKRVRN
jgi:hypothetical protein